MLDAGAPAPPPVPYRGIQPFRYADHSVFFAREEETRHLLQLVAVYRGVMLYGDSGVGKSSLINAGLFPAAVQRGFRPERVRVQPRPGEEIVIRRIGIEDEGGRYLPSSFADADEGAPLLVLSCEEFSARVRDVAASSRPLLVFDQFEELVTLFDEAGDPGSQRRVGETLGSLLREELPAKLLFVFREDYLARIKPLLAAAPELVDQALRLRPPASDALPTIIRGPFERHPGRFEHELGPGVAEQLRAALADRFGSGEVSLSEVQTVCLRLWRSDEPELLLAAKGIQGLLEDYLGEELDRLPDDLRYAAGALLSQMVTSAGTRNVISAEDLIGRVQAEERIPRARLEVALARLEGESKLVRRERRRDLYLYEVTSEFLLPWIGRRREELVRNRERRRFRRRLFVSAAIAAVVAVVAVVASFGFLWAIHNRDKARLGQAEAARSEAEATASAAVARSTLQLETDPAQALATALGAVGVLVRPGAAHDQAMTALGQAVLASHLIAVLRGSKTPVVAASFASGGTRLVTVLAGGRVDVWDAATVRHLGEMSAGGPVAVARFSRDGSLLAIRGRRGWSLWDTEHSRRVGALPAGTLALGPHGGLVALAEAGRTPHVRLFAVGPDGLHERAALAFRRHGRWSFVSLSFSADSRRLLALLQQGQWALWDVRTGRTQSTIRGLATNAHPRRKDVGAILSRDQHVVAVVTNDVPRGGAAYAFVRRYNAHTGRLVGTGPLKGTWTGVGSQGDRSLILADDSGAVEIVHAQPRTEVIVLRGHSRPVTSAVVSDGGDWVATASADLTTRIWDARTGELRTTLLGHRNRIATVAFSPDDRSVVTTSDDGTSRLWHTLGTDVALPRHANEVGHVAFSESGRLALTTAVDGTAFLVTAGGTLRQTFTVGRSSFRHNCYPFVATQSGLGEWWAVTACDARAVLNPSGTRLVTGQDDPGGAQLWTPGNTTSKQLGPRSAYVESALFVGPKKRWVAVFSEDGANLYDAKTGVRLRPLWTGYARPAPFGAAASANGRYLVVGNREPTRRIEVWDVPARRMLHRWAVRGTPKVVAIDRAGAYAAAGMTGSEVRVWRVRDGKRLAVVPLGFPVRAIAFSPDGKTLATATDGNTVVLWNVLGGTKRATLSGHTGGVNSVEFSPDGKLLVTASDDGTVRVWGATRGETRAVLRQGRPGRALDASFDPSGTQIIVGASNGGSDIYACPACGDEAALLQFARDARPKPVVEIAG